MNDSEAPATMSFTLASKVIMCEASLPRISKNLVEFFEVKLTHDRSMPTRGGLGEPGWFLSRGERGYHKLLKV